MSVLGFIPSEFEQFQGEGDLETIFLCEKRLVPAEIPKGTLFLAKEAGSIQDFLQLFVIFDESFKAARVNYIVFALGSNDISKNEKQLSFNVKTNVYDFHNDRNRSNRLVSQAMNTLCETLAEFENAKQLISFDPMSRESSGFHNAAVHYVNRRMTRASEKHKHYNTWKRFQRDVHRRKKGKRENFPLSNERFVDERDLKSSEVDILVKAALLALDSDGDLECDGARFNRKF